MTKIHRIDPIMLKLKRRIPVPNLRWEGFWNSDKQSNYIKRLLL